MPGPTGPPSLRKAGAKIRTHAERANKTRDFFRRKSGKTGKTAVTQDNTQRKSSGEKKEGKETDTSIILYIRTEDEGNGSGRERIQARKDGTDIGRLKKPMHFFCFFQLKNVILLIENYLIV